MITHAGAFVRTLAAVAGAAVLAGCGGGGYGGGGTMPPATYSIGGSVAGLATGVQVTLTNNASDSRAIASNGAFAFKTLVMQGGVYAVTVSVQPPGQSCAVARASGSVAGANVTNVAVSCMNLPQYAYVVNNGDNTVSQYSMGASGALAPLSVPTIATGLAPQSVTIDPTHHYVYVTNLTDNTVSQYAIQSGGALKALTPGTAPTGRGPWAMALEPTGHFAYVINSVDLSISVYAIGSDGTLTQLNLTQATTPGGQPWNITISPNGKSAYVSNHTGGVVSNGSEFQYALNATTGAITPLAPVSSAAGAFPSGVAVDPTSTHAYAANAGDATVSQYSIGADGTLTSLTPATVVAGFQAVYVAIQPSGQFAYVTNFGMPSVPSTVSSFTIGSNGALTALSPSTVAAGIGPVWMAFDTWGQYAYVLNAGSNTVTQYSAGADGLLTPLSAPAVATGTTPFALAITY